MTTKVKTGDETLLEPIDQAEPIVLDDSLAGADLSGLEQMGPLLDSLPHFAAQFDKDLSRDICTSVLGDDQTDLSVEQAARLLQNLGLATATLSQRRLSDGDLPALAKMKDGAWKIVINANKDTIAVSDPNLTSGFRQMAVKDFYANFAREALIALPELADIERRHVAAASRRHWFWGEFRQLRGLFFEILIGTFVANLLAVAISLFALQVYDRVIPNQSETTLWVLVTGVIVAVVLEGALRRARSHLLDVSGRRIELEVLSNIYRRLVGMRLSDRPMEPGAMAYIVREFGSVREFFTAASVGSVADIPFLIVFLALIYGIAGHVVWIIVVGMVLIVLPSLLSQSKMSRLSNEMLGGTSAANRLVIETCYHMSVLKGMGAERLFQRKWDEINVLNTEKTSEQRLLAASLTAWAGGVQNATYVAAVVAGVYMVFEGSFTVGTIIAVSILSGRTLSPVTQLSGTLARWQQVKSSLEGVGHIMDAPQERPPDRVFARKEIFEGSIEVTGLQHKYDVDSTIALNITKLVCEPGEVVGILGMNGSGKSTLLMMISGIYSADVGTIKFDGLDTRQLDPDDLRRNVGYLPQEIHLFKGTLRENLSANRFKHSEQDLFDALEFAGLSNYVKSHPRGLDMEVTDGGEGFSVGQRQSVGLARLYLQDPRVVLLDEPTASFDQNLERKVTQNLATWLVGKTCIMTTHRTEILTLVDRLIVLQNGQISLVGPKDDVIAKLRR